MAQIRVESRDGVRWFWWVLWLIILALVAFFVWVWGWGPTANAGPANSRPVTDYRAIVNAPEQSVLLGRPADLRNVVVGSLVGSRAFWVGQPGQEALVAGSGDRTVQPGSVVNIQGVVRQLPPANDLEQRWNLTPEQARQAESRRLYVDSTRIDILRP